MTDRQELRKRAFSQAFQRMNQQRLGDNHLQPAKRILSYPLCSTGVCHPEVNQENTIRLDLDLEASVSFEQVPGTQVRHIQSVDLQYANPALYNYASLQYELYGNGPGSELKSGAGAMPPPVVRNLHSAQSIFQDSTLPTPEFVRGKSLFGPSPYIRPDSSPPLAAVGDSYVQHGPGPVVYEDGSSPMSDAMTAVGPLTPSALHFGDLSLNSPGYSLPSSSIRGDGQQNRTTVRVVPTSSFASIFPEISPNEVLVLFNNGKEARKADKYPLCSASRFFSRMLDGPFLDPDLRRCIRLRDDFPYAISTMLYFIETGNYECNPHAYTAFPLLTPLDYHIHAYLVSSKYGVVALQERALIAYIDNAAQEMKLGFMMLQSGQASDAQKVAPGYSAIPLTGGRVGGELLTMPIDRFLNSLVLLWKNTPSRYDPLRKAVLKLIKRDLNKFLRVPFFVTLMQEMVGFGDDVVASLGDDGFEVKAFQVSIGGRSQAIRFGV